MAASIVRDGESVLDEARHEPTLRASLLPGAPRSYPSEMLLQLHPCQICLLLERHTYPHHPGVGCAVFSSASSSYWCRRTSGTNIVDIDSLRAMKFNSIRT